MSGESAGLRRVLSQLADEVVVVDMRQRVRVATHRRRRRTVASAAVLVCLALVVFIGLVQSSRRETLPPAEPAKVIRLADAPVGALDTAALVVFAADGRAWAVGGRAEAVRLLPQRVQLIGPPTLSADGRTVVQEQEAPPAQIQLQTFRAAPRKIKYQMYGAPIPRRSVLSPDGKTVAVLVGAAGQPVIKGGVQLIDTGVTDRRRDIPLFGLDSQPAGGFSQDGTRLVVLSVGTGTVTVIDVATGRPGPIRTFAEPVALDVSSRGWAISPDADRAVVPIDAGRGWAVVSTRTGAVRARFARPYTDRLIAWTADDHLVWGRSNSDNSRYTVLATTLHGAGPHVLHRMAVDGLTVSAVLYPSNKPTTG